MTFETNNINESNTQSHARAASLIFAATALVTVASAAYSEVYGGRLSRGFFYTQSIIDLLLVTDSQTTPLFVTRLTMHFYQ